jgi:hypothetical protein
VHRDQPELRVGDAETVEVDRLGIQDKEAA